MSHRLGNLDFFLCSSYVFRRFLCLSWFTPVSLFIVFVYIYIYIYITLDLHRAVYGVGLRQELSLEGKSKAPYPMGLKSFVLGFLQPLFNILPNPLPPPLTFLFLYMYDYSTRTSSDWCTHIDHFHLNSSSASFFD